MSMSDMPPADTNNPDAGTGILGTTTQITDLTDHARDRAQKL